MYEDIPKKIRLEYSKNALQHNSKKYLSFALRYSDGRKTAFITGELSGDKKKDMEKIKSLELPNPYIDQKLIIPEAEVESGGFKADRSKVEKGGKQKSETFFRISEDKIGKNAGNEKQSKEHSEVEEGGDFISEFISTLNSKANFTPFISYLSFSSEIKRRFISNSNGVELFEEKVLFTFEGEIGGEKDGELEEVIFSKSSLGKGEFSPDTISSQILSEFTFGVKPLKTGKYNVVLTPKVVSAFIDFIIPNFLVQRIKEKLSRFSLADLGKKLFSESINIGEIHDFDSAEDFFSDLKDSLFSLDKMKSGVGWRYFDDEGSRTKNFWIIKSGEIRSFITSKRSSEELGIENTSSAVRGTPLSFPSEDAASLFLAPGKESLENVIEKEKVLLIVDVIGMHTGDDIRGDFSAGCRGFIMPDRIPFRTATISGNIYKLLSSAVPFSNFEVFGKIGVPSLLLFDVDISSS